MTIDLPTAYRPGPFVLRVRHSAGRDGYASSVEDRDGLIPWTVPVPAYARKFATAADAADYAHARAGRFAGCVLAVVPADEASASQDQAVS